MKSGEPDKTCTCNHRSHLDVVPLLYCQVLRVSSLQIVLLVWIAVVETGVVHRVPANHIKTRIEAHNATKINE